ncbi:helix-turn-helix transcriptional regulator [Shewanella marisflavi]|uniref:helix-turn-helix transcriptional regulator n=1 Tax=Shewanella marisflavi TaxID=260364 RepID=UPI003AAEF1D5
MYIRQKELLKQLSISRTTLWRMVKRGDFPEPNRDNPRILFWNVEDVERWCLQL